MANYEIEIKSLIGDALKARKLVSKMEQTDPGFSSIGKHKQLNHYFTSGNAELLRTKLSKYLPADKQKQFEDLVKHAKDLSVRTRWANEKVMFVIKATVDDTSSSNGTARLEFETEVDLIIEELDKILLDAGFQYQAKWSREREEYKYQGLNVTIDKNAGYGYLAEFESVIDEPSQAQKVKASIRQIMTGLGIAELPQDRLERMFNFYNQHWQEYYGTEKIFNIQ